MNNVPEPNRCPRCGGSTAPTSSGRITQWVVACTCKLTDLAATEAANTVTTNVVICQSCGKRMEQGRVGSFTQWVFRSDICSCENPQPMTQEVQVSTGPQIVQEDDDLEEEPGLELDDDKFPHERYKPFSLIGKGASGTVYLCWDKILAKRVAIKVLHHMRASQVVAFQEEARTMSRLSHENIIRVLDFGVTTGGVPFMVMEIVKGASLMNYIAEFQRIQPPAAVYFFRQICKGLGHAHSNGIFHRDIKSSNILISNLGTEHADAKIIDFGVAGLKSQVETKTNATEIVGSPYYMAPDMAMGLTYSERSEIYSLGCCLFEALTGELPFRGASPLEVLKQQAHEDAPALSELAPDVVFSEELEKLVARCLNKDPNERYANTGELAEALANLPEYRFGREVVVKPQESLDMTSIGMNPALVLGDLAASKKPFWKNPITIFCVFAAIVSGAIVVIALTPQTGYTNKTRIYTTVWNESYGGDKVPDQIAGSNVNKGNKKFNQRDIDTAMQDTEVALDNVLKKQVFGPPNSKIKKLHQFLFKEQENDEPFVIADGDVRDDDLADLKDKKFSSLAIDQCNFTGVGLKHIRNSGVKVITIESSKLNDEGLKELGQIKTLTTAYLRGNPLTGSGFKDLEGLPLKSLFLRGCPVDDSALQYLGKIKTLERLELDCTHTSIKAMGENLKDLPRLVYLSAIKTAHSPTMEGVEKLTQVLYLRVDELKINDQGLKRIATLPKLSTLDVQYGHFTDAGLLYLGKIPTLTRLDMSRSSLCTDAGVSRLIQMKPNLQVINVQL